MAATRSRWLAYALCCAFIAACGGGDDGGNNTGAAPSFTTTVADQNLTTNAASSALPFTIADADTSVAALTVTASSSNPTVVPNDNTHLTLGGSGANRTITVTPVADGDATITLAVNDGSHTTNDTFVVHSTSGTAGKTFDSPADGAQLAAALANLSAVVGGGGTTPKAMHPKAQFPCSGGGTIDLTDNANTAYAGDGRFIFADCAQTDDDGNRVLLNGQLVTECTDPEQDQSNCNFFDFDNTFGKTSDPLTASITGTSVDVDASFYNFVVSTVNDNNQQTFTELLDGRIVVSDNGESNCGSADVTVETVDPLTVDQSTYQVTAGQLNLTAPDGSTANVIYHQDGSVTVTVDGVAQDYTTQQLSTYCGGV